MLRFEVKYCSYFSQEKTRALSTLAIWQDDRIRIWIQDYEMPKSALLLSVLSCLDDLSSFFEKSTGSSLGLSPFPPFLSWEPTG